MNTEERIQKLLFDAQDLKYKDFQAKLIPTLKTEKIIGVRTPELRAIAKKILKTPDCEEFLKILPHKYYEENNLHGFIIEGFKSYERTISELDTFLPHVDNWATCDMISPKVFKKHLPELYVKIHEWIRSDMVYTVRFGLRMLMKFYLDEAFTPEILETAASVKSDEYYINMMTAWFFATALTKQYDSALPYLLEQRLDLWTHNKTIQKCVESLRISAEQKKFLKALKR